jgi:hypothetical protein
MCEDNGQFIKYINKLMKMKNNGIEWKWIDKKMNK